MAGYYEPKLVDGWKWDEVASSLQKSIRRGLEYEACYFAYIFHISGYDGYLWRRLATITSEDIGNGNPNAILVLNALKNSREDTHRSNKEPTLDKFLFFIHAIIFLCRGLKSRENDNLANLIEEQYKTGLRLEIPSYAKDSHTEVGRKCEYGRFGDLKDGKEELRLKMWFTIWSQLDKLAYPDKYESTIRKIWTDRALKTKDGRIKLDK